MYMVITEKVYDKKRVQIFRKRLKRVLLLLFVLHEYEGAPLLCGHDPAVQSMLYYERHGRIAVGKASLQHQPRSDHPA